MSPERETITGSAPAGPAAGRTRRTQERSGETRARLVACAIEAICDLGYAGATTPLIADRARTSRGALQYHFASRTDLDIAVIDHVANELNFGLDIDTLRARPLEDRVAAVIDKYWQAFTSPMFRAALNIWLSVTADPPVGQRLRDYLAALQVQIERSWLALFMDTGRTSRELENVRRVVMGAVRGCALERMFFPSGSWRRERQLICRMALEALRDIGRLGAEDAAVSVKSRAPKRVAARS